MKKSSQTTLTNIEVVNELRKLLKPYIGIMSQPLFSQYLSNIENKKCKPLTVETFFAKFGYAGDWNAWVKTDSK